MRLIEHAVSHIDDLAGRHIHEEEVRSVAHPLETGLRRRESERSPIGIKVSLRQEERRKYRANGPTPIGPAGRINEGREMNPVDRAPAVSEVRSNRTTGTWPHQSRGRRSMRPNDWWVGFSRRRWSLCLGQHWQGERKHRGNSHYAQHSNLSFFKLPIVPRRDYQTSPGHVTRSYRQKWSAARR